MGITASLKRNDWLRGKVKRLKIYREYLMDARFMNTQLLDGGADLEHLSYRVMLRVHSLEKGLSYRNPRAFGPAKASELMRLLTTAPPEFRDTTAYRMGTQVLNSWVDFNRANSWGDTELTEIVQTFLATLQGNAEIEEFAGVRRIDGRDRHQWSALPFDDFISSRHSTRRYDSTQSVTDDVLLECVQLAMRSPSACNRQMVRLRVAETPDQKRALYDTLHGTGGIDYDSCRLAVVTFDARSLEFYGERNQGFLNAGLFAMTLVYALHWRGVGSCLLQFGNTFSEERVLARQLGLPPSERIAVGLSFGVLESSDVVPSSVRLNVAEVLSQSTSR